MPAFTGPLIVARITNKDSKDAHLSWNSAKGKILVPAGSYVDVDGDPWTASTRQQRENMIADLNNGVVELEYRVNENVSVVKTFADKAVSPASGAAAKKLVAALAAAKTVVQTPAPAPAQPPTPRSFGVTGSENDPRASIKEVTFRGAQGWDKKKDALQPTLPPTAEESVTLEEAKQEIKQERLSDVPAEEPEAQEGKALDKTEKDAIAIAQQAVDKAAEIQAKAPVQTNKPLTEAQQIALAQAAQQQQTKKLPPQTRNRKN